MKGKALLFGLNYSHCKKGQLKGCINDVYAMSRFIQSILNIPYELYTDDVDKKNTSYDGIVEKLYALAIESYKENLDFVWIHYSGHGSSVKDVSGDEADGMDEGLVPSDYESKGILIDDILHSVMCSFNPKTKILFVCDACHSGTILDLRYTWNENKRYTIDNSKSSIKSNITLISGCMDNQTSADAFNLMGDNKSIGALTASFLKVLSATPEKIHNSFKLLQAIRKELKYNKFSQYPCLSSNFDLTSDISLIPIKNNQQPVQQVQPMQPVQPVQPVQPMQPMQKPTQQQLNYYQHYKPSNSQYFPQQYGFPQKHGKYEKYGMIPISQASQASQTFYTRPYKYNQAQYYNHY